MLGSSTTAPQLLQSCSVTWALLTLLLPGTVPPRAPNTVPCACRNAEWVFVEDEG